MKFRGVIAAFGILTVCCSGAFAVDCTDKVSMQAEQRRCFSKYGLELNVGSDKIQDAIQNDPEAVCQQKESYSLGLQCVLKMGRNCMVTLGQSPDILPDVQKSVAGLEYMCANIHNIDSQCAKQQNTAMQQCAMREAMSYFSEHPTMDLKVITCKAFDIAADCAEEKLNSCWGQTKEVFVHFTRHYMMPPACKSDSQPEPEYRFTTMAPMTTVEIVTGVPMLPDVECYSQSSIQLGQQKCFDREGLTVELPDIDLGDGRQAAKKSYLDAILSNSRDFHAVCRELPKYQRGMGCAMEVARYCMPAGYKDYLPDSRKIQLMLAELCGHVDDINQKCVASKASALFDCGYRKGTEHRTRDVKALLCNAFKFNTQCQKEVLPPCGCKTTRLYVNIAKKYLNPPACTPNYDSVPVCLADSDKFAYTGVATQSVASAGFVAIVGVLACLFFM